MPKINFDTPLKDARGAVVYKDQIDELPASPAKGRKKAAPREAKKMSDFVMDALLLDNSRDLSKEKKLERAKIAFKVGDGGRQDYSPDEITEIKEVTGKAFGPLIYGRLCELTDK